MVITKFKLKTIPRSAAETFGRSRSATAARAADILAQLILTASRKVVYVLVKMIFLPSMVDLNHKTKIWWKRYSELNAEKIETRKNLRKIFHPERACLTAPLKILMTIFLEFQIRAENIYFQKPSFFSEFAWILTFVFIFFV